MRVAVPVYADRISPVFDAAAYLLIIDVANGEEISRRRMLIQEPEPLRRARCVAGLGVDVLICSAISRPLEVMLGSFGVRVIARKYGSVEEVLQAYISGQLTEEAFMMPGCPGRRRGRGRRWQGGRFT